MATVTKSGSGRRILKISAALGVFAAGGCATESIVVEPATGLKDGQVTRVTLSGFAANTELTLAQCRPAFTIDVRDCDLETAVVVTTDAGGSAAVPFRVKQHITYERFDVPTVVDCRYRGTCAIGVFLGYTSSSVRFATLAFRGEVVPELAVEPSSGLNGVHEVTVTGTGFQPNERVFLQECFGSASHTSSDDCAPPGTNATGHVLASATGTFTTRMNVYYSGFALSGAPPLESNSCDTEGECAIFASVFGRFEEGDAVPISFKAIGIARTGSLSISPQPVVAGAVLQVDGSDWAANTTVALELCGSSFGCSAPSLNNASSSGAFSSSLATHPLLVLGNGPGIAAITDCTAAPGACRVQGYDFRAFRSGISVPIAMQPVPTQKGTASLLTPLPLPWSYDSVAPSIVLQGSGWTANRELTLFQCQTAADLSRCWNRRPIATDANGAFQQTTTADALLLHPEPTYGIDCSTPGSCSLVIGDSQAYTATATRIRLEFVRQ